jgi:hypothetical protein
MDGHTRPTSAPRMRRRKPVLTIKAREV